MHGFGSSGFGWNGVMSPVESGTPDSLPFASGAASGTTSGTSGTTKPSFTLAQIIQQLQTQWGGSDEANGITYYWATQNVTYSINAGTPTNVSGYTAPEGGSHLVT